MQKSAFYGDAILYASDTERFWQSDARHKFMEKHVNAKKRESKKKESQGNRRNEWMFIMPFELGG